MNTQWRRRWLKALALVCLTIGISAIFGTLTFGLLPGPGELDDEPEQSR
jgi:hypothetical protein